MTVCESQIAVLGGDRWACSGRQRGAGFYSRPCVASFIYGSALSFSIVVLLPRHDPEVSSFELDLAQGLRREKAASDPAAKSIKCFRSWR